MTDVALLVQKRQEIEWPKIKNNSPGQPVKKEIVDEVPVRIVIDDASFGDIALFIYQASISERLVRIRDFNIVPSASRLRFEGTIIGYRLNADDPKKEPPKK